MARDRQVAILEALCAEVIALIDTITAITVTTTQGPSGTPINAAAFNPIKSNIQTINDNLIDILSLNSRTT